ncbi:MAG TPA: RNA methyltransferase [Firmicutes bacterium]|nr:RNA methyltransferase [Bacillota bacterium]
MPADKITARTNEQVKLVKRLQRRKHREQTGLFSIEGVRIVEEALPTGLIRTLFFSPKLLESGRGESLLKKALAADFPVYECTEDVLGEMSQAVSAQGVLAVVEKPKWEFVPKGLFVVADEIQDPGNMGALIRTSLAAGAAGLIVTEGSVDLYNPKVIRATMGAVFYLPHWLYRRKEAVKVLKEGGIPIVAADLVNAKDYYTVRYPQNMAVVIGNEARGVNRLFLKEASDTVKIPLIGPVESLNASVAAGILLYEILRQQRGI